MPAELPPEFPVTPCGRWRDPLDNTRPTAADASRGSSGSPVFLCSSGKLASIVYAQAMDTLSISDTSKLKIATLPTGAGLAACIPASAILQFLETH